jgi:tryptophan synthase alpha chain
VPFSDPIADGPSIQRATERGVGAGGNLARTLDLVADVRASISAPLVLFTYVNPVVRMGARAFAERAAACGVDGVLLLDLPIEESAIDARGTERASLDQIFLVSPTTTDAKARRCGPARTRFSLRDFAVGRDRHATVRLGYGAEGLVARVRALTSMPVAVGFGISRPEHVRDVCAYADAAVVGSAIVDVIGEAAAAGRSPASEVESFVRWLKSEGK